jgi:hypothetical protein
LVAFEQCVFNEGDLLGLVLVMGVGVIVMEAVELAGWGTRMGA